MNLPEGITNVAERPRAMWGEASQVQRYGVMGGVAVLIIGVVVGVLSLGGAEDDWDGAILYANLEFKEAAQISNRLAELGIRHKLTTDASAILVPDDEVRDLRLQLAGEGLPKTGRMGFEIFDEAQLAMTDFLQKVNFQRALQQELELTLNEIEGVGDVRVHLVIPEPSLFVEEQNPVTASVALTLQGESRLKTKQINAIAYLISASVEGLDFENVIIVDNEGNLLSDERDPLAQVANKQFQLKQQVERALEKKVQTLMDQVIGKDRSRVRINVVLDFSQKNIQRTLVEPGTQQVIISEETNEKSSAEQGSEEQAVRNYEVNRTLQNVIGSVGSIDRISMALTVDKTKVVLDPETRDYVEEARKLEEIDQLAALAKEAIGYDEGRGDKMTVFAMEFDKTQEIRAKEEAEQEQTADFWTDIAINVAKILGIIAALITLRFIIQAIGRGVGVEEEEFERPETPHELLLSRIQGMVRERPEDAAKLVRTMLMDEGGG